VADVLRVCALYPDLMNIYADRGNLQLLRKRCEWRGIGFELSGSGLGDALDPADHDLFYIGGGQDRDQALCAEDLATVKRDALHAAAADGKVVFAVCGGYQLLGHAYELGGERLPGVGLVDLETVREEGTVVGTYLHGPLLPKNSWFADWLTAAALRRDTDELGRLDDTLEDAAHAAARRAAGI